jgi:hypothetical protein
MSTLISILNSVKPPLRWIPEQKEFTTDFLQSKSRDPNGPSLEDLTVKDNSVLQEAVRILGRCLPPSEPAGRETGLVVGYVQSGKTLSFETVIALARDNGYGLVIVLAGTKDNLREQSEDRLKKDLGIEQGGDHWYHLSNPKQSQQTQIDTKINAWRKNPAKKSLLITVLKHGVRLAKLSQVLKSIDLRGIPSLIIDDESDQASLNTHANRIRTNQVPSSTTSTTYERILELRDVLPHHSYLQYTATPQANLLLAQTDLLNPNFSELVTPGEAYTGGKTFFISSKNLIEKIPINEVPTANSPLTSPPKSLLKALRLFLLIASEHSLTRKKGLISKDRNRTMMVHPAIATSSHKTYLNWVEKAFKGLKKQIESSHTSKLGAIEAIFQGEYDDLLKTSPQIKPLPELIGAMVDDVLDDLNPVEVNGTPDAILKIDWKATKYWILVGGAKLDRGYTVEGLCVTYMPRALGGSPAADTLQQRARFFGYKRNYLGLCRVFLLSDVCEAFSEYVEHEEFIRTALAEHRGKPLRDWRRDFILNQMLKPTRPNVVGLDTRRVFVDEWMVPKVLHRDANAIQANRLLLENINRKWSDTYQRVNAATIPAFAPKGGGLSPNEIIEGIPLSVVLEDFLLRIEVKDPRDAEEHSATLVALSSLLAKNVDLTVDVYILNNLQAGYRTREGTTSIPATDHRAPINQYFSQSANTINDRSFFTPGRVSLQLRKFDLGHVVRSKDQADIRDVAWYALYVPQAFGKGLVVEER